MRKMNKDIIMKARRFLIASLAVLCLSTFAADAAKKQVKATNMVRTIAFLNFFILFTPFIMSAEHAIDIFKGMFFGYYVYEKINYTFL